MSVVHLLALILVLSAAAASANDLSVDRRTVRLGESVTITVSLEGAFAEVERVTPPVTNLVLEGEPSVSSEFSWINGTVIRRKVFRFTAVPSSPGTAVVGPLVLKGEDGRRETLGAIAIQVVPDLATRSNDPATILKELLASGREPFFVVVDLDRSSAWVGEEVVVTWTVYNAADVQRWQIAKMPKLEDFWVEELDVSHEEPLQVLVGGTVMNKVAARRVALFPLRSGRLTIDPLQIYAAVLRRTVDSPFGIFEGEIEDLLIPSALGTIEVRPLPAEAANAVVGSVTLACTPPAQANGGPVTVIATLRGRASLRAAKPPHFAGAVAGDVQVQPMPVSVQRTREGVTMTRSWRYLIFPERTGTLAVPALVESAFDPSPGVTSELRCGGAVIAVEQTAAAPGTSIRGSKAARLAFSPREIAGWSIAALLGVAGLIMAIVLIRRARRRTRAARTLTRGRSPAEVRHAVDELLTVRGIDPQALGTEASDRGEAYRAFRSLADALDRDRLLDGVGERDMERRVRDLIDE